MMSEMDKFLFLRVQNVDEGNVKFGPTTLSITTFNITILSIKGFFIFKTQHK